MYCKKCGKQINDGEKSCLNCGTEAAKKYLPKYTLELYYCGACGREADKTDSFCCKCGAALNFSDIISESTPRHKEMKPVRNSRWMYIPFYPPTRRDEEPAEDSAPAEEEHLPVAEVKTEPEATDTIKSKPVNREPLQFEGEINIEITDDEISPAEEKIPADVPPEEVYAPAPAEEYAAETPAYADKTSAPFAENLETKSAEDGYVPPAPAEPEPTPAAEETSKNPDILFTAPTESPDFVPSADTSAEPEPEKKEPEAKNGDLINYSTDNGEKRDKILEKDAAVNVTKPKKVPEKMALGIIAIVFAVLFPPLGIVLGVITVARGWSVANKTYVRLGIAAIAAGVVMTVVLCVLLWLKIIPAIEAYFKSIE